VLSLVLVVVALAVIWGEQRARGRATYFTPRPQRRAPHVALAPWARRLAVGSLSLLTLIGLLLPAIVLVGWMGRGLAGNQTIDMRWGAVTGSLAGSLVAALLALLAAVPVVVLTVRHPGRATAGLRAAVLTIFSLPHITVAVAVVFFGARYLGPFYQSFTLLVMVYATLFLAQATNAGEAALLQVNPHLEEAARSLGRGPWRTLREVTLPLMSRGLLAGAALVFLTTMKELPATLLLRPTGFDTLAVRIWSTTNDLFYARAAAPALLLLAASAVPMYLLVIRQD
jgi:iron(III) transport system permease protein